MSIWGQRLEALLLDPGTTLGGFGAGEDALGLGLWGGFGFGPALGLGLWLALGFRFRCGFGAPLLLGLLLLFSFFFVRLLLVEDGLRDTLPGWDGGGVAGDVADEPLNQADWSTYALWLGADGLTPMHGPRGGGPDFFLSRANKHLADNDERAAALYARAAFETKLKNYCEKKQVPVPFKRDPKKIDADTFWKAARVHALSKAPTQPVKLALETMFKTIDTAKKLVLNPLSHSTSQPSLSPRSRQPSRQLQI